MEYIILYQPSTSTLDAWIAITDQKGNPKLFDENAAECEFERLIPLSGGNIKVYAVKETVTKIKFQEKTW